MKKIILSLALISTFLIGGSVNANAATMQDSRHTEVKSNAIYSYCNLCGQDTRWIPTGNTPPNSSPTEYKCINNCGRTMWR